MPALDIGLKQVFIDLFDDDDYWWHHRILTIPSGHDDGVWIAVTPDLEVQIFKLADHRVVALARGAEFGRKYRSEGIYRFDELEDGEVDEFMRASRDLASVMGFIKAGVSSDESQRWRIADLAHPLFGEFVPDEAIGDPDVVDVRGPSGLVEIDDVPVFMQRVDEEGLEKRKNDKYSHGAVDPRILPQQTSGDKKFQSEWDAIERWRNNDAHTLPFPGPKSAREWFSTLREAGLTLVIRNADFERRMGLAPEGPLAREHRAWTRALRMIVCVDQFDGSGSATVEAIVRHLICFETAVGRNPRQLDWDGLEHAGPAGITEQGVAQAPSFDQWLAARQRDHAQIFKQGRLLREERDAAAEGKKDKQPS